MGKNLREVLFILLEKCHRCEGRDCLCSGFLWRLYLRLLGKEKQDKNTVVGDNLLKE